MLSASADSQYSQRAFGVGLGMVTHPILADWHPKGEVAKAYGVWNDRGGNPIRSVFIIDKSGVVRFSREYTGGLPNVDEVLAEVDKLK